MKIYTVEWRELVQHTCLVEAESVDDATTQFFEGNFTNDVIFDREFYDIGYIDVEDIPEE